MVDDFAEQLRGDRQHRARRAEADDAKRRAEDDRRQEEAVAFRERLRQLDRETVDLLRAVVEVHADDRSVHVEFPRPDPHRREFRVRKGRVAALTIVIDLKSLRLEMEQQPEYGVGPNSVLGRYQENRVPSKETMGRAIRQFLCDQQTPVILEEEHR